MQGVTLIDAGEPGYRTVDGLTDEEAATVVREVARYFRGYLDLQPWNQVEFLLSKRAENVLYRHRAVTIADVRYLLLRAQSNRRVPGAGVLVQTEWIRLLKAAR